NVYTRTSDSSPLLVVAENALPLPVRAKLEYDSIDAVRLNTSDDILIPAKGSITVSLTASMPERQERTNISMWLATADGATISEQIGRASCRGRETKWRSGGGRGERQCRKGCDNE